MCVCVCVSNSSTFLNQYNYEQPITRLLSCTAGEVASTLSHVMVTNPTKTILTKTQSRLADIIAETQRNLSKLMLSLGNTENRSDRYCW